MKKLFALLLVNVLFFAFNCGAPTDESGVKTVFSEKPKYDEYVKLTKLFEIPHSTDEYNMTWNDGTAVDDEGNIYIESSSESEINVFDSNGNFIRQFGQPGQGPSDLYRPNNLLFTDGNLMFMEFGTGVKILTKEGRYVDKYTIPMGSPTGLSYYNNNIMFSSFFRDGSINAHIFRIYRKNLTTEQDTVLLEIVSPVSDKRLHIPVNTMTVIGGFSFYIAESQKQYEITKKNEAFEDVMIIMRSFENIAYSDEAVEYHDERFKNAIKAGRSQPLAGTPPVVRKLFTDARGNIWVIVGETNFDNGIADFPSTVDIFSSDGEWLTTFKMPASQRIIIKNDRLYRLSMVSEPGAQMYLDVYEIEYLK